MTRSVAIVAGALLVAGYVAQALADDAPPRWSEAQARTWAEQRGWLVGCNFAPSTAINQLEMWQADTFDLKTIDRELGWAAGLGFNSIRVYLHHLPWQQDRDGFLKTIDRFLDVAAGHRIGATFVLLDSCWDPHPKSGRQRDPRPHVHNSGWVQCPGVEILKDPARHDELEPYIKGIISRFRADTRIHAWDIFNEPDNRNITSYDKHEPPNKAELSLMLLKKAFSWARQCRPSQPITAAAWQGDWSNDDTLDPMNAFLFRNSDILTFHCYLGLDGMRKSVNALQRFNRPIICTEYMARPKGCTFEKILPYLKEHRVGAYNWGLVAGKTQTIYPWDSWKKTYSQEPPLWFHDIFRKDGTPYRQDEVRSIRELTGTQKQ